VKQVLQNLRTGATRVEDVPAPMPRRGHVIVRTSRSLISSGTERMLVEFGRAGWLEKARQQPERVRDVLAKVRTDGVLPTIEAVFRKLDQPLPLGYCNVGVVLEVGEGVSGLAAGDRVACNGKHAEVVAVPANLCVRIPDGVSDDEAVFAVVGAIGLQGIRLLQPTLGEAVAVTGLGLVGLVTVQLLRAHGCRVLGLDFDRSRLDLAKRFGAEVTDLSAGADPIAAAHTFSRGRGMDGVLITASTQSSEPAHQAAVMCRKRGRIVLVGVAGLELVRSDFYEKELSFQVSCSYGPGRYDPAYEEGGQDYPVGFVRWTEQRNLEAVLDMMASGRLDVRPLVSHRFPIARAEEAYDLVAERGAARGIVLEYSPQSERPDDVLRERSVGLRRRDEGGVRSTAAVVLCCIGAGDYATAALLPAFKAAGAVGRSIVSQAGVSSVRAGRKFGFERASTDASDVLGDASINTVIVATRHDTHASYALDALKAGKHVFVEKPLAISASELDRLEEGYALLAAAGPAPQLMVGFNRRFAPQVRRMKELLSTVPAAKVLLMTVNAGAVPPTHWTQDREAGGGRIAGEACHFVDLLRFLVGAPITGFEATCVGTGTGEPVRDDKAAITLRFGDGSVGTIVYAANGHKSFPKERLDVFAAGRVLQLDNFRTLSGYGWPGFSRMKLWRQDKGQRACVLAFVRALQDGTSAPIPADELFEVTRATIAIADALR